MEVAHRRCSLERPRDVVQRAHELPDDVGREVLQALRSWDRKALCLVSRLGRQLANKAVYSLELQAADLDAAVRGGAAAAAAAAEAGASDSSSSSPTASAEGAAAPVSYLERWPSLSHLRIRDGCGAAVTDRLLSQFLDGAGSRPLSHLSRLDVKRCLLLGAASVRRLVAACPMLTAVAASRWVDASGLRELSHLSRLSELDLGDATMDVHTVDDACLKVLPSMPCLRRLSLNRCVFVGDKACHLLGRLVNLRSLDLSHTRITGAALGLLAPLRHLESLMLAGCCAVTDTTLAAGLTDLATPCGGAAQPAPPPHPSGGGRLAFASPPPSCGAGLPALTLLDLSDSQVGEATLAALAAALPALSCLRLGLQYELCDDGLATVAALPHLSDLSLGNFSLSGPPPPGGFAKLTRLTFGGTYSNRGVDALFPLPSLTHLHVVGIGAATDACIRHVVRQSSLQELCLAGGYLLSPSGLLHLAGLGALRSLQLASCPNVGVPDLAALLAASCSAALTTARIKRSVMDGEELTTEVRRQAASVVVPLPTACEVAVA